MRIRHRMMIIWVSIITRHKLWIKNSLIMGIAAILLMITGAVTTSFTRYFEEIPQSPAMRNIGVSCLKESEARFLAVMKAIAKDEPHIQDYFPQIYGVACDVKNAASYMPEGFNTSKENFGEILMEFDRHYDKRYLLDGRWIREGETRVGLVPKYFSMARIEDLDKWNTKLEYIDGASLIGQTIEMTYETYQELNNKVVSNRSFPYSFQVIGTYDNVRGTTTGCYVILPYNDVKEIQQIVETYTYPKPTPNEAVNYCVMVDEIKNVPAVEAELAKQLKIRYLTLSREGLPGTLSKINDLLSWLGKFLGLSLFIVSLIMLMLMFYKSMKQRTSEIGIYKAVGYPNSQIVANLLLEVTAVGVIVFLSSFIISYLFIQGLNLFIASEASIYLKQMQISFVKGDVLVALGLCIIVSLLGSLYGIKTAISIEPKSAISKSCD
jgi:hypothetical protein